MGMDIPKFFMAGDLNSIVFKPEHSMGIEKITLYFVVGIYLFNNFQRGQILEYNFPLGTIFWPNFPVGRGSHRVCEKGVSKCLSTGSNQISDQLYLACSMHLTESSNNSHTAIYFSSGVEAFPGCTMNLLLDRIHNA